ncbi:MAG: tetratricopeptide repeat protein [bacterium]
MAEWSLLPRLLASPGFWLPITLLLLCVAVVVLARRRFGRRTYALDDGDDLLRARPGRLTRLITGAQDRALRLSKATGIQLLETRYGAEVLLSSQDRDAPPLRFPLAHADAPQLLQALCDAKPPGWNERIEAVQKALGSAPRAGATAAVVTAGNETDAYEAAGHWNLAALELWPKLLANPVDRQLAGRLLHVEQHRLDTISRMRLALALLTHHPDDPELLLELARLYLSVKNRPEARAVLDRLVQVTAEGEAPPFALAALAAHWRAAVRERKQVPVPPSKSTMGIEVNLPTHRLDGSTLVVDERFRADLGWFLGFRLLPGFWGPPRRAELVDLWGTVHVLMGDPMEWAACLVRAAPHLCELHDEGLLWPGTGARIRRLRRRARNPKARG